MSKDQTWYRAIVLSTLILFIAFAVRASGQGDKPSSTFATVDFAKVANDYKAKQAFDSDAGAMQQKYQNRLARREQMPLLGEEKHKQLDALIEKQAPTADDQKKRTELENEGAAQNQEVTTLRQTVKPDAAQSARIQQIEQQLAKAQEQINQMKDGLENEMRQFRVTNSEKLMNQI